MIQLLTIIGVRPQIIKAAALSRAVRDRFGDVVQEKIATKHGKDVHRHQGNCKERGGYLFEQRYVLCLAKCVGIESGAIVWRKQNPDGNNQNSAKSLCQEKDEDGLDCREILM